MQCALHRDSQDNTAQLQEPSEMSRKLNLLSAGTPKTTPLSYKNRRKCLESSTCCTNLLNRRKSPAATLQRRAGGLSRSAQQKCAFLPRSPKQTRRRATMQSMHHSHIKKPEECTKVHPTASKCSLLQDSRERAKGKPEAPKAQSPHYCTGQGRASRSLTVPRGYKVPHPKTGGLCNAASAL